VNLSWDAASGVVGYNVYRGIQSGGPYSMINSVLDAGTSYADSSVQGGQIYYYVTTSVDSTSAQSHYSNETQAVIPAP
jgi:mannan endo-1,4-beta-mannosidase